MPRYVVRTKKDVDPRGVARGHGIKPKRVFGRIKGFSAELTEEQAEALRKNPQVVSVEDAEGVEAFVLPWGLDRIDQRSVELDGAYRRRFGGEGVIAYIMDTGIAYGHQEFEGRARPGFDAYDGDGSDWNGHGTHVAGTVGGAWVGVAPDVGLVSVRVLNSGGSGYWDDVIAAAEWLLSQPLGVVNISLGGPRTEAVNEAIEMLVDYGFVVVCAAGNSDSDVEGFSPACAVGVIAVGATTIGPSGDLRASYSNWGALDIFAPGSNILSAAHTSPDGLRSMSGTSMAAPHVTGVVALALEETPDASPFEVLGRIRNTATRNVVDDSRSITDDLLYAPLDSEQPGEELPPNKLPVADFTVENTQGREYVFRDISSDPDGHIVYRAWVYGDGSVSPDGAPDTRHTYQADGVYTVQLEIADDRAGWASVVKDVTVGQPQPEPEPDPVLELDVLYSKLRGTVVARLAWSGARTEMVDVLRDDVRIATVPNTGVYTDHTKGRAGARYRVCEEDTGVCSLTR